jgi:HK97 gp10 family phage protein
MAAKIQRKDYTKEMLADLQKRQFEFVTLGGQEIQANAKTLAPVNKMPGGGNLRNSIITTSFVEDGVPTSETGPTAEYAPYVEYGTGIFALPEGGGSKAKKIPWVYFNEQTQTFVTTYGNKAQPFMEPGFQSALPTIARLYKVLQL